MKKILASILLVTLLQSCGRESMSEINTDPNSYYTATPATLLTYAEKQLADYVTTPNVNINNFRLTMQYWQETTYIDESNYDFSTRNVSNNVWTYLYIRSLKNLSEAKKLVNQYAPTASEAATWPATKANQLAILDLLQVYSYQLLVDANGDVPYSEAGDIDAHPLPKYDSGKDIYASLISRTKQDIASLTSGKSFSSGEKFYNGDVTKWKKFANSLLLKLAIGIADSDPALAQATAQQAIAGGVFASKADDALMPYAASPNYSQLYANLVASNRNDYVAGKTLVDYMNAGNDVRRDVYFQKNVHYLAGVVTGVTGSTITFDPADPAAPVAPQVGDQVFVMPNTLVGTITSISGNSFTLSGYKEGSVIPDNNLGYSFYYRGGTIGARSSFNSFSRAGAFAYAVSTPGILLNYTEVAFYLAEASARWGIGGDPATNYANAVTASFLQWGKTAAEATAYLATHPYDATNWKKSIGEQAWVAMYDQPLNSFNFWRRLDYPVMSPAVAAVAESEGKIPVRLKYPVTEQSTNPTNYEAGSAAIGGDKLTTKLFWDKN
ncbi:SusD/RagB family nutrient-binding outer membrane lipoprotein [Chryseobacterium suipulveris]|uniref:SusD/RagB family nutrient-binding outer membrane lipoprotein n=1 Tax=Chryseobacterium suipulveris TaxID=2929800 RepID=A0ABY4BQJ8_9FLAO|nr:SusD/RagB family nutrient-binding outer membrane lipoprotein [Chryseobacterium suipulveris]UOE41457.1 SusD/RagB family nutrient-binding outer membrane lipoprotein [Chryseobacterium suipulveris]